jgi:hypothetical protein
MISVTGGNGSLIRTGEKASDRDDCADCVWTLVKACKTLHHGSKTAILCQYKQPAPDCRSDQEDDLVYLQTATAPRHVVDEVCLGGSAAVVPVGERAARLATRYLKNVRPPPDGVRTQPRHGILVQLPVYFSVDPPRPAPAAFGPAALRETIKVRAASYTWDWGDGSRPLITDSPGGPYPDGDVTHTYHRGGQVTATLTTAWSGSYTFRAGGRTLGPYPVHGTVRRAQPVHLTLHEARSHLVR